MSALGRILVSSLVAVGLLALPWIPSSALADDQSEKEPKRLALVVGNADYVNLIDIPSSAVDVQRISAAFKELGFEVTEGAFESRPQLEDLLVTFRQKAEGGDLVVVYFSGHGFSHGPFNYLASTRIAKPPILEVNLLDSAVALEELEDFFSCPRRKLGCRAPGLLVFIIDACRSFTTVQIEKRSGEQVIAKGTPAEPEFVNSATNILIAFAARPGNTASGTTAADQPSIFTKHLVPVLGTEGMDLEEVIEEAATAVIIETHTQIPGKIDWNKARAFLRPTAQILDGERVAWESAVGSGLRDRVEFFSVRYAISRYAAAARKWLAEHPQGTSGGGFTLASPIAIDRAWRGDSEESVAVRRTQIPLGFPRLAQLNEPDKARALSDAELGLVPSGTTARDLRRMVASGGDNLPFDAAATEVLGVAVALRKERAFLEGGAGLEGRHTIEIPAGTPLQVLSAEKGDDEEVLVRAEIPGARWPVHIPLSRSAPVQPLELGRSLREIVVPPAAEPFLDLADTALLEEAIVQLRESGYVLTWVSLAAGKQRATENAEDLASRVAHVRYVLSRNGVDGKRVTAILEADDVAEGGIRARLFGYYKGS